MENKKRRFKGPENTISRLRKRTLGLLFIGIFAATTLVACSSKGNQINANESQSLPSNLSSTPQVFYLSSINEAQFDLASQLYLISQTTPLEVIRENGKITSIANPPIPCGEPSVFNPNQELPSVVTINEREILCQNIQTIANMLQIPITQNQIEKIASQIIITSLEDIDQICGKKKSGCYLYDAEKILLYLVFNEPNTIIHEKTHAIVLYDDKYLNIENETCYLYDYNNRDFSMIFKDENSQTGWSTVYLSNELLPSIMEDALIKVRQKFINNSQYPAYVSESKMNEEMTSALKKMFDALDFSGVDSSFILRDGHVSMSEIFEYVENVIGSPDNLATLNDLFSQSVASQGFEMSNPITESDLSPFSACK